MSKNNLPKIIAVVGPTATGKSDLAVLLAKKFNGEVISVDSRQIYKGMNIGTGKITKKEMLGIKHYLLDIANPKGSTFFNVTKFKKLADKTIADVIKRGKLPILAGGTGFWIDAVAFNQTFPDVPPNPLLRKRLRKYSNERLLEMLMKLDPEKAKSIDWRNTHRVIRAIEIAEGLKKKPAPKPEAPKYQTLFIGLDLPDDILLKKITLRLDKRLKQGMIAEVKKLKAQGVSWKIVVGLGVVLCLFWFLVVG
jgi:tRNA dimethylallyltransferase